MSSVRKTSAGTLVIRPDGRVLAVSRRENEADWGLPFGICDPGETPEETAIRETREETGLRAYDLKKVFEEQARTHHAITYLARVEGTVKSSEEGRADWVDYHQLTQPTSTYWEYNRKLLREVLSLAQGHLLSG